MPQRRDRGLPPLDSDDSDALDVESSESDSNESSCDSDEELAQVHVALTPVSDDATPRELQQALEASQKLLLNMHGPVPRASEEERTPRGFTLAAKQDTIKAYGAQVFYDTLSGLIKERWLSACTIEDGVKTELFQFISNTDHELMSHKDFGGPFSKGINSVRSEMLSDVKSCAGSIFGMSSDIFFPGYNRHEEQQCSSLIVNPAGLHTKFAPVLFPHPEKSMVSDFLKTAALVKVLRASIFSKTSTASTTIPAGKTKAKIWELHTITKSTLRTTNVTHIDL
ncbi:hypothetical protein DFH29DRAFT_1004497 [Suillus ampliporus]|nr:hypothetical protein DFH29DRAFT_1004497 [Suillus ampliporus]